MPAGRSSAYPFPGLRLAFRRPWVPAIVAKVCDQRLKGCPVDELRAALDTWKDVTFEYTSTDTVDAIATPTPA